MEETVIVELDPATLARIDALAERLGVTRAEVLRRIVARGLEVPPEALIEKDGKP